MYKEELLSKPAILALNKVDLPDSDALVNDIKNKVVNMKGILYIHFLLTNVYIGC